MPISITALVISFVIFVASIAVCVLLRYRRQTELKNKLKNGGDVDGKENYIIKPFYIFLIGFFLAATILFYPIYYTGFTAGYNGFVRVLTSVLLSMQNVLRLFTLNSDFGNVNELLVNLPIVLRTLYAIYMSLIFIIAPALTAKIVLSFFKGATAFIRYIMHPRSDIYIFSELNERSLFLAQSIIAKELNSNNISNETKEENNGKPREPIGAAEGISSDETNASADKEGAAGDDHQTTKLNPVATTNKEGCKKVRKRERRRKSLIVFTDVYEKNEEYNSELVARAKSLGAICMKKDILEVGLKSSKKIGRKIYLIGNDEDENVQQALSIVEKCRNSDKYNAKNTEVYVFSDNVECESLINSLYGKPEDAAKIAEEEIKIRRVNAVNNLIIDILRSGVIFKDAKQYADNTQQIIKYLQIEKNGAETSEETSKSEENNEPPTQCRTRTDKSKTEIGVVVVGMGNVGIELIKAICWCGQMPGYNVTIHAFDVDSKKSRKIDTEVTAKLESTATELMKYNGHNGDDEAHYYIKCYDDIDVNSDEFYKQLSEISPITSVFVTLGEDEANIQTSIKLRTQFERDYRIFNKVIPSVYAVVNSDTKIKAITNSGIKSVDGLDYGIQFIGGIKKQYSIDTIEQSDLDEKAKNYHLQWVETDLAENEKERKRLEGDLVELEEELNKKKEEYKALQNTNLYDKIEIITDRIDVLNREITKAKQMISAVKYKIKNLIEAKLKAERQYDWYEYFRRSSIASAIYFELMDKYCYSLIDRIEAETDPQLKSTEINRAKEIIGEYEHKRWNAFMRSEGYDYHDFAKGIAYKVATKNLELAGMTNGKSSVEEAVDERRKEEKAREKFIGKLHNLLVSGSKLPKTEKPKDAWLPGELHFLEPNNTKKP